MRMESLRLLHFRNYSQVSLPLAHDITIFYGDNAQGKTNLLEGIYTAARGFPSGPATRKSCPASERKNGRQNCSTGTGTGPTGCW